MTGPDLHALLTAAADDAEGGAPLVDPLPALAMARRRTERRRGHAAALAFVVFVVLLQLAPADALGADRPTQPVVAMPVQQDVPGPARTSRG